jgi:hypothetical protein
MKPDTQKFGGRPRLQRIRDLIGEIRQPSSIPQQGTSPAVWLLLGRQALSYFIGKDFWAIEDMKKVTHGRVAVVGATTRGHVTVRMPAEIGFEVLRQAG